MCSLNHFRKLPESVLGGNLQDVTCNGIEVEKGRGWGGGLWQTGGLESGSGGLY